MPKSYRTYRKRMLSQHRRMLQRRVLVILCLTIFLAWALPSVIAGWNIMGNNVVDSMRGWQPYDFERRAKLAGERLGESGRKDMSKSQIRNLYTRELKGAGAKDIKELFKENDFAFEGGYKKTSDYNKRYRRKSY
ncbi:MAG: hypothetical protein V3V93_02470 [bacterium]